MKGSSITDPQNSNEYVDTGDSEKYLVQPLNPNDYDDPNPATRSHTKLHNIYDNMKPHLREPTNEEREPRMKNGHHRGGSKPYDARSELMMPADNIYGMLTKSSKMDHVTHKMTPSAYETKVSKAEIEAKDKLDELRQAQFVEKLQKEEMGEALSDLKEVTQNGLKTMFADAVGKQNNFIQSVSNYNPNLPRSFNPPPPLSEYGPPVMGPGPLSLAGGEPGGFGVQDVNTNIPEPEEEMGEREFSPDVPMYGPME